MLKNPTGQDLDTKKLLCEGLGGKGLIVRGSCNYNDSGTEFIATVQVLNCKIPSWPRMEVSVQNNNTGGELDPEVSYSFPEPPNISTAGDK